MCGLEFSFFTLDLLGFCAMLLKHDNLSLGKCLSYHGEPCISCMLKLSLLCGTEFSRIFLPELYPWRLSFGLATWKWKGEGVDLRLFLCGWLVLRGHLWISFPEGDFAYGEGWPAKDVSVSCCIAGVGWAPSTVVSQKVVWLCFGFQIWSWRFVVSTYSASVRGKSVFHVNLCM